MVDEFHFFVFSGLDDGFVVMIDCGFGWFELVGCCFGDWLDFRSWVGGVL